MADDQYQGTSTLLALESAANYNGAIEGLFTGLVAQGSRVLDIGAGAGEFARRLQRAGAIVSCVEPDLSLRSRLESEGFHTYPDLEAAPGEFAVITMINVLEHIEDDSAALDAVRRRLLPGGTLFVFVPALPVLYSAFDRAIGHHRRYRRRPLEALLTNAGFHVRSLRWFDVFGVPTALVFRLTGRSTPSARSVGLYDRLLFPLSRVVDRVTQQRLIGKNLVAVAVVGEPIASGPPGPQPR